MRNLGCLVFASLCVAASGDDDDGQAPPRPDAGAEAAAPVCVAPPPPQKPSAACDVTVELPPIPAGSERHLPEGTPIAYCTNPPSSGEHYPVWAAYREYTTPVEWPYLVHNLEHGAVVLAYKCDPPGCPEIVEQLRSVRDKAAPDAFCPGLKRIIIVPSPTIPTKVAAAAWGATYRADCVDLPSLEAFVRDHYTKAPENLVCIDGRAF